eukprot:TRINITY_DN3294_c0_g1_i1.p1 TRINITY_DN3294_c0_g1~~TRINITY_DN3294_c0_g1_i1.p1  ORF type:complete len:224 (-),score=28.27 TRINITY_DN3294_c0_g1_i1:33-704(-)
MHCSQYRRRNSRCSIDEAERACIELLRAKEMSSPRGEATCSLSDYLGPDELSQIFNVILYQDWLSSLQVCKTWHKIATNSFKERIMPVLSHSWTGWSKWTTRFLKPIDWDVQATVTEMQFMRDKTLSGKGKNQGFDSTWIVKGTYDLDTNRVCWHKEFVDGNWKGRTIKYEGRLVFAAGSVSIEGVTVLEKKEEPENPWDRVGDTGAFKLTSLKKPDHDRAVN